MDYFKYILYFILGHMILTFVYRGYIYHLYKTYDIRFKRRSAFFSLVRSEIKENIIASVGNVGAHKGLQKLLVLHGILSITGKIIMALAVLIIIMVVIGKVG
jgi:hypothetical protein